MDWEDWCAEKDGPPVICYECGAAFDPSDVGEIEGHRDEHWIEWLRSQCPIPVEAFVPPSRFVMPEIGEPEVPF